MTEVLVYLSATNWLEWVKTTFDMIKGVSWPFAVFMIVWIFRTQLRDIIPNLTSVGPSGAVFQPSPQSSVPKFEANLTATTHPLKTAQGLMQRINDELQGVPVEERLSRLVFALAEARVERAFEALFHVIFGSQIQFIRNFGQSNFVLIKSAEEFFELHAKPVNPDLYSDFGFKNWISFLIAQQLVKFEGDTIRVTELGVDFLMFIDVNKPNEARPN